MSPSPEPKAESAEQAVAGRAPRGQEDTLREPLPLPRPTGGTATARPESDTGGEAAGHPRAKVSPALDYESDRYRLVTPRVRL